MKWKITESIPIHASGCSYERLIEAINEAYASIPEKYRKDAYFDLDAYGFLSEEMAFCYLREETDEEYQSRQEELKKEHERNIVRAKALLGIKD